MTEPSQDANSGRITRVIDFRIPLPWLLGIASGIGWALVSMWFMVNQLVRDVSDLQITVKAGNSQAVTVAGEMALLRFRVENLEAQQRVGPQMSAPASPIRNAR